MPFPLVRWSCIFNFLVCKPSDICRWHRLPGLLFFCAASGTTLYVHLNYLTKIGKSATFFLCLKWEVAHTRKSVTICRFFLVFWEFLFCECFWPKQPKTSVVHESNFFAIFFSHKFTQEISVIKKWHHKIKLFFFACSNILIHIKKRNVTAHLNGSGSKLGNKSHGSAHSKG